MRKKYFAITTLFILMAVLLFSGCGKKLGPGDVLDNDTGKIYSLGTSKEVFDQAFGSSTYNENTNAMDYLSKTLSVEFDESNCAMSIKVYGGTNRFSFNDFDFSKSLEDIKGRYHENVMAGANAYSVFYTMDGQQVDLIEAYKQDRFIKHALQVRTTDQEISGLKAGDFVFYAIEYGDGITQP